MSYSFSGLGDAASDALSALCTTIPNACSQLPGLRDGVGYAKIGAALPFAPKEAKDALVYAEAALADAERCCAASGGGSGGGGSTTPLPPSLPSSCDGLGAVGGLSAADVQAWCRSFQSAGMPAVLAVGGAQQVGTLFTAGMSAEQIQAFADQHIARNAVSSSSRTPRTFRPTFRGSAPSRTVPSGPGRTSTLPTPDEGEGGFKIPSWAPWVVGGAVVIGVGVLLYRRR